MSRESDDNCSSINSGYTDHGTVLTTDTEQFIIGQRVWVGGIRPGQIAYIGETHFAPGEWAGIVLDEPNGKNDGCVAGKRYFQCEAKRGIFSRLTRLTVAPLSGAQTPTSPIGKISPDRSHTVSPTSSFRSSFMRSPGKNGLTVGDRVIVSSGFGSRPGILRYLGETQFAQGNWCGVELDEDSGKNNGTVDGIKYFECKPKYGVFVPIAKVSLSPSSLKSRIPRAGSRESLTSVGTMNSVATTHTSRMRMSSAQQRKSTSLNKSAALTTPKSQYSYQDLLREKQSHIEQLMIERDLDREDAQNQALNFQRNISEVNIYSDTLFTPIYVSSASVNRKTSNASSTTSVKPARIKLLRSPTPPPTARAPFAKAASKSLYNISNSKNMPKPTGAAFGKRHAAKPAANVRKTPLTSSLYSYAYMPKTNVDSFTVWSTSATPMSSSLRRRQSLGSSSNNSSSRPSTPLKKVWFSEQNKLYPYTVKGY